MKKFETLECMQDGAVMMIALNRPDKANVLNGKMAAELLEIAQYCDYDASVKAVVLTGNGNFFCAGGDIKEMKTYGDQTALMIKSLADLLHRAISTFARMSAPVIVAVNGMAAGAGFSIAVIGDVVLASDTASFTMAYTKAGLSPDGSSSYYLPRLIGVGRTKDLMLTNRTLSVEEAQQWGLVSRIVSGAELGETAMKLAKELAAGATQANAAIKNLMLVTFNNSLETQMEIEGRYVAECAGSKNGREGLTAFIEKRPPNFE